MLEFLTTCPACAGVAQSRCCKPGGLDAQLPESTARLRTCAACNCSTACKLSFA